MASQVTALAAQARKQSLVLLRKSTTRDVVRWLRKLAEQSSPGAAKRIRATATELENACGGAAPKPPRPRPRVTYVVRWPDDTTSDFLGTAALAAELQRSSGYLRKLLSNGGGRATVPWATESGEVGYAKITKR